MKNSIHWLLLTLFIVSMVDGLSAQSPDLPDSMKGQSTIILPPLVDVIDSAIKHSSISSFRSLEVKAKESNLKSQRNYWTRNFGVQADTRYGTFDNYSSNANGQSTSIFTTTSRQFNYGVGLFLKFPAVDLLDRKNLVNKAKVELEQAKKLSESQQDELRQLVIRLYNDVLLKEKLLNIKSLAFGNSRVNMEMVEREFRNGKIQVSEYVRISDIVAHSESDYEIAKTEFISAKLILEDMVGFTFVTGTKDKNENY